MKQRIGVRLCLMIAGFMIATKLDSQEEMTVDLADQAVSPQVMKRGEVQTELALSYTKFLTDEKYECINPLINVRIGVFRGVEFGFTVAEGKNRDVFVDKTTQGQYPLGLGNKIRLFRNDKTTFSIISFIAVPFTAHTSEQAGYWSPTFLVGMEQKINDYFKLTFNSGLKRQTFGNAWQVPVNLAAEVQFSSKLSVFGNYYGQIAFDELPQHNLGLGIEYKATENFEFFLSGGRTINPQDENAYVAGGLAFRMGKQ